VPKSTPLQRAGAVYGWVATIVVEVLRSVELDIRVPAGDERLLLLGVLPGLLGVVRAVHRPQDSGQRTDRGSEQNDDSVAVPWDDQYGQSASRSVQALRVDAAGDVSAVAVVGWSTNKFVL
jgi:hypothetical protein